MKRLSITILALLISFVASAQVPYKIHNNKLYLIWNGDTLKFKIYGDSTSIGGGNRLNFSHDSLYFPHLATGATDTNIMFVRGSDGKMMYLRPADIGIGNSYWSNNGSIHPTDTTNAVAIGTNSAPAGTMLRVNDGAVIFEGSTGTTPVSGAGTRMMWIPEKGAFRAGVVDGTQWDNGLVGLYSTAMGRSTTASGVVSTAMGVGTTASGSYSTAMGQGTTASGDFSTAMGNGTTASGYASTAMGMITNASGEYSTASGYKSLASGISSFAIGDSSMAIGNASFAGGRGKAYGAYSFVFGDSCRTSTAGSYGVAMGYGNKVTGQYGIALGLTNTASAWASFASGELNTASGENSFVSGIDNLASGNVSFAGGKTNVSSGFYTVALGNNNFAKSISQTTLGMYCDTTGMKTWDDNDWVGTDPLLSIGNGTYDPDRNNALTILKNGTAYIGDASSTTDPIMTVSTTDSTTTLIGILKLTPQDAPPVSASEGMIYADTDHHLYYYNGTAWVQLD